eukprot:1028722-Amphidinium_carterae.1
MDGAFPLNVAAYKGHVECLKLLLKAPGVNAAQVNEKSGWFPLNVAAYNGHVECLKLLLKAPGVNAL